MSGSQLKTRDIFLFEKKKRGGGDLERLELSKWKGTNKEEKTASNKQPKKTKHTKKTANKNKQTNKKQKGWIPGSRLSMKIYSLTYSRQKMENLW